MYITDSAHSSYILYNTPSQLIYFNQDCQFRIVQINNMGKVPILCHHGSQQLDDIITLDHIVVTSLVVHCKLYNNDKMRPTTLLPLHLPIPTGEK